MSEVCLEKLDSFVCVNANSITITKIIEVKGLE